LEKIEKIEEEREEDVGSYSYHIYTNERKRGGEKDGGKGRKEGVSRKARAVKRKNFKKLFTQRR